MIIFIIGFKCQSFKLSSDRDFFFESQKFDTLSIYAYIVNHNILKVFVKNDINYTMSLSRKIKLKMIINYEAARYNVIDFLKHDFIARTSKRSFN